MIRSHMFGGIMWTAVLAASLGFAAREGAACSLFALPTVEGLSLHSGNGCLPPPVRELNENILPLPDGSPVGFPDAAFAALRDELPSAKIVGHGEATHGTAEFAELEHRLFRHLVEVHGHRALAYEYDFAASFVLDRWLVDGIGSLEAHLGTAHWIQNNAEVRGLFGVGDFWAREPGPHFDGADRQIRVMQAFDALFYFTDTGGVHLTCPP